MSDQGVRKSLYQKVRFCHWSFVHVTHHQTQIVACYPDGWLSSGQISREVSVMKKKYEKEVMENEGEA